MRCGVVIPQLVPAGAMPCCAALGGQTSSGQRSSTLCLTGCAGALAGAYSNWKHPAPTVLLVLVWRGWSLLASTHGADEHKCII